jgi:tryptophanyl-tRNA synthetase
MSKTVLTGLRANGQLTLGNYLGAILPMIERQKELAKEDSFYLFIPDLHSFTTPIDHSLLYSNTLNNIRIYLASGVEVDAKSNFIYRQSRVSGHSELNWILSCFTYFGEANKMIQFKEKSRKEGKSVSVGLFTYPILMAADILLYNAEYIPLGEDQKQHLELARDLAIRFNNKFEKEIFKVPKPWKQQLEFTARQESVKIRSLQNPDSKMSKSVVDPKGTILLDDDPKAASKKVMSAVTDDLAKVDWNWEKQPGITNLLQIQGLLSGQGLEQTKKDWIGTERYGDLKKAVASSVESFLTDLQTKIKTYSDKELEEILIKNEKVVNVTANNTLIRAQKAVGLRK